MPAAKGILAHSQIASMPPYCSTLDPTLLLCEYGGWHRRKEKEPGEVPPVLLTQLSPSCSTAEQTPLRVPQSQLKLVCVQRATEA